MPASGGRDARDIGFQRNQRDLAVLHGQMHGLLDVGLPTVTPRKLEGLFRPVRGRYRRNALSP